MSADFILNSESELGQKLVSLGVSEGEVADLKKAFNESVESRVKVELDLISDKAEKYIQEKVEQETSKILEDERSQMEDYLKIKLNTMAKKGASMLEKRAQELQQAASDFVRDNLDAIFEYKYGKELKALEEKLLDRLSKYLDYVLDNRLSEEAIQKEAANEICVPIVDSIRKIFEEKMIPLDCTGKRKLKSAADRIAELEDNLTKVTNENLDLSEIAEDWGKRAIIAENTSDMHSEDREKIKRLFEKKSLEEVKSEIGNYKAVLNEARQKINEADTVSKMKSSTAIVEGSENQSSYQKRRSAFLKKTTPILEDVTKDLGKTKLQEQKTTKTFNSYLDEVSRLCDEI